MGRFNPHSPLLANELMPLYVHVVRFCFCFNPHSPLLANELSTGVLLRQVRQLFQSTFAIAGE